MTARKDAAIICGMLAAPPHGWAGEDRRTDRQQASDARCAIEREALLPRRSRCGCPYRADCTVVEVGDIVDFTGYSAHNEVLYARLRVCGLPVAITERSETVGTRPRRYQRARPARIIEKAWPPTSGKPRGRHRRPPPPCESPTDQKAGHRRRGGCCGKSKVRISATQRELLTAFPFAVKVSGSRGAPRRAGVRNRAGDRGSPDEPHRRHGDARLSATELHESSLVRYPPRGVGTSASWRSSTYFRLFGRIISPK